jgi:hypothetical protein
MKQVLKSLLCNPEYQKPRQQLVSCHLPTTRLLCWYIGLTELRGSISICVVEINLISSDLTLFDLEILMKAENFVRWDNLKKTGVMLVDSNLMAQSLELVQTCTQNSSNGKG